MGLSCLSKASSKPKNSKVPVTIKRNTFLATYRRQEWSLPDSFIYYITKHPSTPKCYETMAQSCKHFFIKNPLLIVRELSFTYENNKWNAQFHEESVDFFNLKSKIWLINYFVIENDNPAEQNFISSIIPKIYKSDLREMYLFEQDVLLDDLKFFATKCKEIYFREAFAIEENGSIIVWEKIVENFPELEKFDYQTRDHGSKIITPKTAKQEVAEEIEILLLTRDIV